MKYLIASVLLLAGCGTLERESKPVQPLPQPTIYNVTRTNIYMPPRPDGIGTLPVEFDVITTTPCEPVYGVRDNGTYINPDNLTTEDRMMGADGQELPEPMGVMAWLARGPITGDDGEVIEMCGNLHNKLIELRERYGYPPSMIVLSPKSYENLSINTANSSRYIQQVLNILAYYEGVIADLNDQEIITQTNLDNK